MQIRFELAIVTLAASAAVVACGQATGPEDTRTGSATAVHATANASHTSAAGTFTQTAITGLAVRTAGPNTVIEQTSEGSVSGTLSGTYEDDLRVVIHPNGRFTAHFTIRCQCMVGGDEGSLELVVSDRGELVGPTTATFAGRAVIRSATGELSGLRGVLDIEGTVDLASGLSTYDYAGWIR